MTSSCGPIYQFRIHVQKSDLKRHMSWHLRTFITPETHLKWAMGILAEFCSGKAITKCGSRLRGLDFLPTIQLGLLLLLMQPSWVLNSLEIRNGRRCDATTNLGPKLRVGIVFTEADVKAKKPRAFEVSGMIILNKTWVVQWSTPKHQPKH